MTLGRCSCEFALFCAVHPQTVRACLADSPRLVDCPQGARGPLERTFVLRIVRACLSRQSAPSLADSLLQLGGQSDLYA
jgi:hypothetical protein